jgi:hypothetical protein
VWIFVDLFFFGGFSLSPFFFSTFGALRPSQEVFAFESKCEKILQSNLLEG